MGGIKEKGVRLDIQMLGGFSVYCNEKEIVLGRNSSAKFIQLLQLIWLKGRNGITKEELIGALYDREKITNRNATFNTMLSRARRSLKNVNFPGGGYIIFSNGLYMGNQEIELNIDALEFRELTEQAETKEDEEEKLVLYEHAFELYRGELLPETATEFWVTLESFTYMKRFEKCVNFLGEYAREKKDYYMMERVYDKAASIYPFEEWQSGQIEALLGKGEFKQAKILYDKTVEMYLDELGVPISKKLAQCYESIEGKDVFRNDLSAIQRELQECASDMKGAFYCQYGSFIDIYRVLCCNMERIGYSLCLVLCVLKDSEGKNMKNKEKIKIQSKTLEEAIRTSLRQGDAFTKYGSYQYLILLTKITRENCDIVFSRIKKKLRELTGLQIGVTYYVLSVH